MKLSVITLLLSVSFNVMAHEHEAPKDSAECAEVTKQCEGQGYTVGDHKKGGKGLWVDCVAAVAKGKSINGVTATKEQADACLKTAKAHRKAKHK